MKLFIDDIRNAPSDKWHVARTLSEAIRCIVRFKNEMEEISIDHDISHQVGMGKLSRPYPCEETYAALCYVIGEVYRTVSPLPRIILHTSNIHGAREMQSILQGYGINSSIEMRGAANRLEMEL